MKEPTLLRLVRERADAIRQVGAVARQQARAAGVASYCMDPSLGAGIIREMPDGSRQRIEHRDGQDVVIKELPPA